MVCHMKEYVKFLRSMESNEEPKRLPPKGKILPKAWGHELYLKVNSNTIGLILQMLKEPQNT